MNSMKHPNPDKRTQMQRVLALLADHGTLTIKSSWGGDEITVYNMTEEHKVREYVFYALANRYLIKEHRQWLSWDDGHEDVIEHEDWIITPKGLKALKGGTR